MDRFQRIFEISPSRWMAHSDVIQDVIARLFILASTRHREAQTISSPDFSGPGARGSITAFARDLVVTPSAPLASSATCAAWLGVASERCSPNSPSLERTIMLIRCVRHLCSHRLATPMLLVEKLVRLSVDDRPDGSFVHTEAPANLILAEPGIEKAVDRNHVS